MSHNIRYYTYGEKVDKKKVESDLSAFVAAEDWQEGCCGLPQPIRWPVSYTHLTLPTILRV